MSSIADLGQYMTPFWAAQELVHRYFGDLAAGDVVIEPSCGTGAFLCAVPSEVRAVGVEIDPALAARARAASGREVVTGDFRTVQLELRPTAIIGNPPFKLDVVDGMLDRAFEMLPDGAAAGFILPAYAFQTPSRVVAYAARWSLQADHLPRTLFPGLTSPLVFAMFRKELRRVLVGFALYAETYDVEQIAGPYQEILRHSAGTWREAVARALINLGGEGSLEAIYRVVEGRRPTPNRWWKEKVRQVLQRHFMPTERGRWSIPPEEPAAA